MRRSREFNLEIRQHRTATEQHWQHQQQQPRQRRNKQQQRTVVEQCVNAVADDDDAGDDAAHRFADRRALDNADVGHIVDQHLHRQHRCRQKSLCGG